MRKLLGAALVWALVLVSGSARADGLLKNLKFSGSIDVQGTSANNVTDFKTATYDQIGDVQTRVMLNGDWDILDDVHAKVTMGKNDRFWGNGGGTTFAGVNSGVGNGQAGQNLNTVQSAIFVDQAYFKVDKVFGSMDMTLGRQFYGDQGDMIVYFGPYSNLYGMPVSSLDAARFDWSNSVVGVTGVAGKIFQPGFAPGTPTESTSIDLRGLTANAMGLNNGSLGAYLWERVTHNVGAFGAADNLWIVGVKGKYTMGGLYAGGEIAKNFGQNRTGVLAANYTGWALKADAGWKGDVAMASLNPWGEIAMGSGGKAAVANGGSNYNFTAINPDFVAGGIYSRFAAPWAATTTGSGANQGNLSLSNRVIIGFGVKATPSSLNKLTAGLAYWNYQYAGAQGASGVAGTKNNAQIGSEIDLDLAWKHSDNVTLNGGLGSMQPGGATNNVIGLPTQSARLAYFDVHVKF